MAKSEIISVMFRLADGRRVHAESSVNTSLLDVAKSVGVPIDAPCSGNMTCGKCRIRVADGMVEGGRGRHISEEAFSQGWRLACDARVLGDLTVDVPEEAFAYQSKIRVADPTDPRELQTFQALRQNMDQLGFSPIDDISIVPLALSQPTLDDAEADRERLVRAASKAFDTSEDNIHLGIGALRALPQAVRESGFEPWVTIRRTGDDQITIIDISPVKEALLGLAIDIGTTTVSALLIDLASGEVLAAGTVGNAQIRYGADVINRLIESSRPGGLKRLHDAITAECIGPLVASLAESIGRKTTSIGRVSIAGNTTMTHLFTGVPCNNLRLEPYVPSFFALEGFCGSHASIGVNPDASVHFAPAVGSYVGGDITAGVLASMIHRTDAWSMLIDLGTNGEIVFGNAEMLMACACSAGPAFEGGDISCGMRATDGAIEALTIDEQTMEPTLKIIGKPGQKPVGICGSGLIDAICELYRCGIIDARGRFQREGERVRTDQWGSTSYIVVAADKATERNASEIVLSDSDVENFVRAKGSVFSAIRTLLSLSGMEVGDIEQIHIAGGIGSAINIENAIKVGMLPAIPLKRYSYVGNTSLRGSYAILMAREAYDEVKAIANNITYLELSTMPSYMDEFIAACFLPHTDASLFDKRD